MVPTPTKSRCLRVPRSAAWVCGKSSRATTLDRKEQPRDHAGAEDSMSNDRNWLEELSEEELRPVVVELVRSMKRYREVRLIHGPQEAGRDIVFSEDTPFGTRMHYGIQVKRKVRTGSVGDDTLDAALQQCQSALRHLYTTTDGQEVRLSEVFLVIGKQLSPAAANTLRSVLSTTSQIKIIDGPLLADLVSRFAPHLRPGQRSLGQYVFDLSAHCQRTAAYFSSHLHTTAALGRIFVDRQVLLILIAPPSLPTDPLLAPALLGSLTDDWLRSHLACLAAGAAFSGDADQLRSILVRLRRIAKYIRELNDCDPDSLERAIDELSESLHCGRQLGMVGGETPTWLLPNRVLEAAAHIVAAEAQRRFRLVARDHPAPIPQEPVGLLGQERIDFVSKELARVAHEEHERQQKLDNEMRKLLSAVSSEISSCYLTGQPSSLRTEAGRIAREVIPKLYPPQTDDASRVSRAVRQTWHATINIETTLKDQYRKTWSEVCANCVSHADVTSQVLAAPAGWNLILVLSALFHDLGIEETVTFVADAASVLSVLPKAVLVGDLGSGKSTALRRVCEDVAKRNADERDRISRRFPILVELGVLTASDIARDSDISDAILAKAVAAPLSVHPQLDGSEVWFLDGCDELIHGDVEHILDTNDWLTQRPASVIASSRPSALPRLLPGYARLTLAALDATAIRSYADQYPWTDPATREPFIAVLRDSPQLSDLAQVPLFLSLLAVLANEYSPRDLPRRREGVYEKVIAALLSDWDKARQIRRPTVIRDQGLKLALLRAAAAGIHLEGRRAFDLREFANLVFGAGAAVEQEQALAFAQELVRDGILVAATRQTYGFAHLSLQEYLTALHLTFDLDVRRIETLFCSALSGRGWWEEVIVFYASIVRKIDTLIRALFARPAEVVVTPEATRIFARVMDAADMTAWSEFSGRGADDRRGGHPLTRLLRPIFDHSQMADDTNS